MFKVLVKDSSATFATNGKTFDTVEDAQVYAIDLYCRWTALDKWAVVSVDLEPNERGFFTREYVEDNMFSCGPRQW